LGRGGLEVPLEPGVLFLQLGDPFLILGVLLLSFIELTPEALIIVFQAINMLTKLFKESRTAASALPP
jgi:hypothetical protein